MKLQTLFSWTIRNNIKLSSTVFVQRVLRLKKLVTVFSEKTDVPPPPPAPRPHCPPRIFSFSTALTMKIRPRLPKSNQFFLCPNYTIHENLVRIQPLGHKILCRQESCANTDANTNEICTKNNVLLPIGCRM